MIEQLNEHLVHIKSAKRRKQKWETQLADYNQELASINKNITNLENQLKDEKADVKRLEGLSISSLFSTLLGNKDEKLEKEKEEVIAVQLKLEEAKKTRKEIQASIHDLQLRLSKVEDIEAEYKKTLKMKEELIQQKDATYADQLYELSEREGDLEELLIELDEAIEAGEEVKIALNDAIKQLESAEDWGLFDMFGGGMISTAIKHSHIDDATNSIHHAQTKMRIFQKELLDINEDANLQIDISGLLTFADYFFDGIITDWMVQSRIKDSLSTIKQETSHVEHLINELKERQKTKTAELQSVKKQRSNIIEMF